MRMPRFRIRTIMVAVAVVAIPLGVCMERRSRFLGLAAQHNESGIIYVSTYMDRSAYGASEWHRLLADKYERAARYPWLPVEPHPPEPE